MTFFSPLVLVAAWTGNAEDVGWPAACPPCVFLLPKPMVVSKVSSETIE
jgi:hypothetical protein